MLQTATKGQHFVRCLVTLAPSRDPQILCYLMVRYSFSSASFAHSHTTLHDQFTLTRGNNGAAHELGNYLSFSLFG